MPALVLFLVCLAFSAWFTIKYDENKSGFISVSLGTLIVAIIIWSIVAGICGIAYAIFLGFNNIFI